MSLYKENSQKNNAWRFPQTLQNDSIYSFIRNIEKHFFAEVTVQNCTYTESTIDLAIQLDCNLTLFEVLHHANIGTWGNLNNHNAPLPKALKTLKNENNSEVRIDEFSIFLKDTSIIVKRTNNLNISDQLGNILRKISSHYIYFTKGLSQKPYEIYIPVIEENEEEFNLNDSIAYKSNNNKEEYWGIYFESEDDAVIYDVNKSAYLPAELHLCMAAY